MMPGARGVTTDACVPVSKLPEMLIKTREDIDAAGLTGSAIIYFKILKKVLYYFSAKSIIFSTSIWPCRRWQFSLLTFVQS